MPCVPCAVSHLRLATGPGPAKSEDSEAGDAPLFSDHMAFAPLQWLRCVTTHTLFEDSDPVQAWLERMLKAYGGLAGDAKTIR